jgi:photosystem II stability/assembly factor-like uncharacterized protein
MRKFALFLLMAIVWLAASSQTDIFTLMERKDLRLSEIERIANRYFDSVGTGRGTGYKQYQRWLYERKFHVDDKGYLIDAETEGARYQAAKAGMQSRQWSSAARGTFGTWVELGPRTWTHTSGWNPGNGRITAIAVHPGDPEIIYASSSWGGIWKSWNGGTNWMPLTDFTSPAWMHITHITIDPGLPLNLFAAVDGGGVIKSTNDGLSWSATGPGPDGSKKVLVHPRNSDIVFSTANNGIFRSIDRGTNWTRVHTESKEDIEFNPADPNIMYASGSGGASCFWRSTDNGLTWTPITHGITNSGRTLIGVSPANPNVVYAVQARGNEFGRLSVSTNAGQTFVTVALGDPGRGTNYFGYATDGRGSGGQANYDMAICVNPSNGREVMIGGIICWKSTNAGQDFVAKTAWNYPNTIGYNHADVLALEWVGNTIYSGSDGGIYKSTNGGDDWTDLSAGLGIRQFYRISCSKTDPNVITGGAQDNGSSFRRSDGTWVDWIGADGMDNIISPTDPNIAFGTSQHGDIYKTTNAGATMINVGKPSEGNWVTPIVMHPTDHNTIYGGWTGIYKSVNGGTIWTKISGDNITGKLEALAVAPTNTQYIYGSVGDILYATSDGGASWIAVTAPAAINSIFVSPVNPQKIYLACKSNTNRVFVSTDMGRTFTNLSRGLPDLHARSIVVDDNATESMYVGMSVGVYYRDNIDTNWVEHANGLPLVAVDEVEIQKSAGKLRVATHGRGVWETDLWTGPILVGTTDITDDGGIITAKHMTGSPPNEDFTKVIDNRNNTKYLTFNSFGWVRYSATNTWVPQGYSIVSANDHPDRDPKGWTLMASTDNIRWVVLHSVTDEVFSSRGQEKFYTFNNTAAYKYYTLHYSCKSGTIFQMAELKIYGIQQPLLVGTTDITDDGGEISAQYMAGSPPNEDFTKVIDNRNNTKYVTFNCSSWLKYSATNTWVPKGYSIVSGNDHPTRDPVSWNLQASMDNVHWVFLHIVTNQVFSGRRQEKTYTFNNTTPYKYYVFSFNCKADSIFQISEMRIFGIQQPLTRMANPADQIVVTSPEELAASGYKAFPNPVSGKLTITGLQHAHTITLYDMHGKKILTQKVSGHIKDLDMQKLKAGMYQLIIIDDKRRQTNLKIVKQ